MDCCPVCYETFSSSPPEVLGRQLPCEHVACTQCLQDCFEDVGGRCDNNQPEGPGVRCPECFTLFPYDCAESVPLYEPSSPEGDSTFEEEEGDAPTEQVTGDDPAAESAGGATKKTSKLAAFLSTNKAENHVPVFGVDDAADGDHDKGEERLCESAGCTNRAVENLGVCPSHTKRLSVVSVSAMVHKFKDTKLSSVALKSDKVEVRRGGVAGVGEPGFDPDAIGDRFRRQERLELGEAVALIEAVRNIFREEDNMVELEAPVMVVGDVHGQYFDLLNILKKWRPDHSLLFLGDYVDRGQFSCEVILHLFALKLRYPDKVHLIRGNHECSSVSAHFGFKDECKAKYGLTVYYRFLLAFQTMPICALIITSIGRIFACHGGISPDIKRLSDIENIDRFAEPEMEGPLCDMLWADPMNEDDSHKLTDDEYQHFLDTDYIANQVRGCSYMFGYHAVQRFLRDNRLMYMVRAHEVQEEGFRSHFPSPASALAAAAAAAEEDEFTDEDSDLGSDEEQESYDEVLADTSRHLNPTVLTVFSAPNYCDRYRNKAAVLHIEKLGYYTVNLLEAEPHPDPVQESDVNVMQLLAVGNTCPYMPTSFREFLKVAVQLGRALKPASTTTSANTSMVTDDLAKAAAAAHRMLSREDSETNDTSVAVERPPSLPGVPEGGSEPVSSPKKRLENGTVSKELQEVAEDGEEGEGDAEEGEEDGEGENGDANGEMPTFKPRQRAGMARMTSAPILAATGGRRSSSVSSGGSGQSLNDGRVAADGALADGGEARRYSSACNSNTGGDILEEARTSFLGAMSSLSRRSMRGFGLMEARASSPGVGLLSRQNTWTGSAARPETSAHYRKAHARDGINEMHPDILNRRISCQEAGEMEASGAREGFRFSTPSTPSTTMGTPEPKRNSSTLEELLFGPTRSGSSPKSSLPVAPREEEMEAGDMVEPSPAPPSRGVRRQFSLDLNVAGQNSATRVTGSKSRDELAELLSNSSITELAEMEEDVELDDEPFFEGENGPATPEMAGMGDGPTLSLADIHATRSPSLDRDGTVTPSPRSRKNSHGDASPSQILFTHEEIVVLKLLFSLFDTKGKNFITRDDIIAYAEEGGDFAQLKEVDACMEAIDADMDGMVGLSDYINFAARLKEIHTLQQQQSCEDLDSGSGTQSPARPP